VVRDWLLAVLQTSVCSGAANHRPGNTILAGSQAGVVSHSWPSLDKTGPITSFIANVHDIEFSPDGKLLAIAGGDPSEQGTVEVLTWPSGMSVRRWSDHDDTVVCLAWLDDQTVACASLDHQLSIYSLGTQQPVAALRGHSKGVTAVAAMGLTLVSAGLDQHLRVWDRRSWALMRSLNQHTQPVLGLATRPLSEQAEVPMVASIGEDRTVRFWQPTIGRMVRFARVEAIPLALAWTVNGSAVLVTCSDGRIRQIDPDTAALQHEYMGVEGWGYSIAIHPQDRSFAAGGSGGQLRRFEIQGAE
jgi:WD40 repeat protein